MATKVTSFDIARELVKDVGGNPNNTAIVRAVAIWVSYESGTRILSNNPWNLRPGSDYNTCNHGPDSKNFTVFCTWQDGVKATAQRLSKTDYRGYRPVYNAIQKGDPLAFFGALAKSRWSSDHYGGGGKLVTAFKSATSYDRALTFASRSGSPVGSLPTPAGPMGPQGPDTGQPDLGAWADIVKFPVGHIITEADVNTMIDALDKAGYFKGDTPLGAGKSATRSILMTVVGQQWDKSLQDSLQLKFQGAAAEAGDPFGIKSGLGGVTDTIIQVATYIVAIILIIVGLYIYGKSASQGTNVPA